jgi:2-methylcitrate dehydratase PrpD
MRLRNGSVRRRSSALKPKLEIAKRGVTDLSSTRQLAQFAAELSYSDLPPPVVEKAKEFALHAWGVQLAGSTLPWSKSVYRYVRDQAGSGTCTVVNHGLKTSAVDAAFANGTFGHSFEMDDNHSRSSIKGGCALLPAGLAIGERQMSGGVDLIAAIVAGYEVMTRICLAVTPVLMQRGYQPTATCGPFGAAVSAGKLMAFDQKAMLNAISIVGSHSSGLMEAPATGRGELKRIHGGLAASNGVRSALLAREGLTGPATMLEGEQGFCRAFGDQANMSALTKGLGTEWEILNVHYKIYAQDGYIQPMTEALERLLLRHKFGPEDVAEIRAGCCRFAHEDIVGVIREPKDLTSAQYSANFSLALFLVKGGAGFKEYGEESLSDPKILALSKRIHTEVDDEIEREWQKARPRGARITVKLRSGEKLVEHVPMLRSMTAKDVDSKFEQLAAIAIEPDQAARFMAAVHNLDSLRDISVLSSLLVRQ